MGNLSRILEKIKNGQLKELPLQVQVSSPTVLIFMVKATVLAESRVMQG